MLCCIEIADQEERLQLLPGEAGKHSIFVQMPCHNAYNNKNGTILNSTEVQVGEGLDVTPSNVSFKVL